MTDSTDTPFDNRCDILASFWVAYKGDPEFEDFISYNDLGLPIAYALATDMVKPTPKAEMFVNETWDLFLAILELEDDGYESLDDILPVGE